MRKKIFKNQREISFPVKTALGLIISSVIGIIVSLIVSLIFSYIISKSPIISKLSIIYFLGSIIIGSLVCGFLSNKMLSFKGLISGLISGIPLSTLIFLLMLSFSNGRLNTYSISVLVLILLSSTIGGIISANTKRRK